MQPVALEPTRLRWSGDPATYRSGVGGGQAGQRGDLPPVANIVPVTLFAQRGAAAAEGSQRDKCVRSKLGALSRRAESGDFVAQWGGRDAKVGSAAEQFEAKGHKESADLQFQRTSSSIMLQRPHSGDKLTKLAA